MAYRVTKMASSAAAVCQRISIAVLTPPTRLIDFATNKTDNRAVHSIGAFQWHKMAGNADINIFGIGDGAGDFFKDSGGINLVAFAANDQNRHS